MPTKLNPCKRCGGRARLAKSIVIHGLRVALYDCMYECRKCGYHPLHEHITKKKIAVNAWNTANPKEATDDHT